MGERTPIRKRHHRTPRTALRALFRDAAATSTIEYGLIVSLIVLTMFASLAGVANVTVAMWNDVSSKVINAR